ncbi:MAG: hypothetical protein IJZ29_02420 [Clostridia bacterium]|nr:hypothetical protein [Clostridia bacterium]
MAENTTGLALLVINGVTNLPSSLVPSYEITRNTERSLDGTLYVDLVYQKEALEINWDYLSDSDFQQLKSSVNPKEVVQISYLNNDAKDYYVESIDATPFIIDDEIAWQAVQVKVVEV